MIKTDYDSTLDWTDTYDKNILADSAESILKKIIMKIHTIKLPVYAEYNVMCARARHALCEELRRQA